LKIGLSKLDFNNCPVDINSFSIQGSNSRKLQEKQINGLQMLLWFNNKNTNTYYINNSFD